MPLFCVFLLIRPLLVLVLLPLLVPLLLILIIFVPSSFLDSLLLVLILTLLTQFCPRLTVLIPDLKVFTCGLMLCIKLLQTSFECVVHHKVAPCSCSVQFSPLTDWVIWGFGGMIQQRPIF